MWTIYSYFKKTLKVFFPSQCFICKKENKTLCDSCIKKFTKSVDSPFIYTKSIYSFKDQNIKNIIHAIKYHHRKDLVEPLTSEIIIEIQKINNTNWILVPIPMPKIRKYIRGYNQSEIIAKALSKKMLVPIRTDILLRIRNPKRQVKSLTRSERLKNQHNSFDVACDIRGLNIILVDDVITTGATMAEAHSILKKSGASKVLAISIAH